MNKLNPILQNSMHITNKHTTKNPTKNRLQAGYTEPDLQSQYIWTVKPTTLVRKQTET